MTDPIADLSAKLLHFERNQNELISRVEKLENPLTRELVNGTLANLHVRLTKLEQERDRGTPELDAVVGGMAAAKLERDRRAGMVESVTFETEPKPSMVEQFARFAYHNFGGWLDGGPGDLSRWHGLRHLPSPVAKRIHEIHDDFIRTGQLPDWCKVT